MSSNVLEGAVPKPQADPPTRNARIAAGLLLALAGTMFVLPTTGGMAVVLDPHGAAPWLLRYILPALQPSEGDALDFLQKYWKTLPALIGGALIANPRSRQVASYVLLVVMSVIVVCGTIVLQFGQIDDNIRSIAATIAETSSLRLRVAEEALKELLVQIRLTRELAMLFLAGLAGAATAAYSPQKEKPT